MRGERQGACRPPSQCAGKCRVKASCGRMHLKGGFVLVPDLERELLAIDREEKKLVVEIKAAARAGNEKGAKLLAKSLVRLRGQRTKVLASAAQLRGVRASIGVRLLVLSFWYSGHAHTRPTCIGMDQLRAKPQARNNLSGCSFRVPSW